MELRLAGGEVFLRLSAIVALVVTACVVAFDTQTKVIMLTIEKKATYKDVNSFKMLVYVTSAAAGHNMLQLCKHCVISAFSAYGKGGSYNTNIYMSWVILLLDQVFVYMIFATNTAALQSSLIAVSGVEALQWMKVCDRFTRFCFQIGGALFCGYVASFVMAMISTVSAYQLFRMYSPKRFLRLKTR